MQEPGLSIVVLDGIPYRKFSGTPGQAPGRALEMQQPSTAGPSTASLEVDPSLHGKLCGTKQQNRRRVESTHGVSVSIPRARAKVRGTPSRAAAAPPHATPQDRTIVVTGPSEASVAAAVDELRTLAEKAAKQVKPKPKTWTHFISVPLHAFREDVRTLSASLGAKLAEVGDNEGRLNFVDPASFHLTVRAGAAARGAAGRPHPAVVQLVMLSLQGEEAVSSAVDVLKEVEGEIQRVLAGTRLALGDIGHFVRAAVPARGAGNGALDALALPASAAFPLLTDPNRQPERAPPSKSRVLFLRTQGDGARSALERAHALLCSAFRRHGVEAQTDSALDQHATLLRARPRPRKQKKGTSKRPRGGDRIDASPAYEAAEGVVLGPHPVHELHLSQRFVPVDDDGYYHCVHRVHIPGEPLAPGAAHEGRGNGTGADGEARTGPARSRGCAGAADE